MLFTPYRLDDLTLTSRIVMAPLTRCRAGDGNAPTALNAQYYAQRASAGLIVAEGAHFSPSAPGYLWTPGLHTEAQVAGWRGVALAVHGAGGRIFVQLWHCGRISHKTLQPDGIGPIGPSEVPASSHAFAYDADGKPAYVPCSRPRAATLEQIAQVVRDFGQAAANARAAGLDGVEIHGANGYLVDQFLNANLNQRTDAYGGSVPARARLLCECLDAVAAHYPPGRIGIRLSPYGAFNDMPYDPDLRLMLAHLGAEAARRGLGYIHLVLEPSTPVGIHRPVDDALLRELRAVYPGCLILCGGMTVERAERYLSGGLADLVAFGRLFIANPDLVERLRRGGPFNTPDPTTFYGGGERGYVDYPTLAA
jgi:N-ethylmaleimide reductase